MLRPLEAYNRALAAYAVQDFFQGELSFLVLRAFAKRSRWLMNKVETTPRQTPFFGRRRSFTVTG